MSRPARKTTTPPPAEPDVELSVAADPVLPPGVAPAASIGAIPAVMAEVARLADEIAARALDRFTTAEHDQSATTELVAQVYTLATGLAAVARANA